jgi:hypothetical protein
VDVQDELLTRLYGRVGFLQAKRMIESAQRKGKPSERKGKSTF